MQTIRRNNVVSEVFDIHNGMLGMSDKLSELANMYRESVSYGTLLDGEMNAMKELIAKVDSLLTPIHSSIMNNKDVNFRDKFIWTPTDVVNFVTMATEKKMKDIGRFISNRADIVVIENKVTKEVFVCNVTSLIHILEACLYVFLKHYGRSAMYSFISNSPFGGFLSVDEGGMRWKKFCDVFFIFDSFSAVNFRTFCSKLSNLENFEDTFSVKFFNEDAYSMWSSYSYDECIDITELVDNCRGYDSNPSRFYNLSITSMTDDSLLMEVKGIQGLMKVVWHYLNSLSPDEFATVYSVVNDENFFSKGEKTSTCFLLSYPNDSTVLDAMDIGKRNKLMKNGLVLDNGCMLRVGCSQRRCAEIIDELEAYLGKSTLTKVKYA